MRGEDSPMYGEKKWRLNVYSILHYFLNNGDIHLGKRRKKDFFPFLNFYFKKSQKRL